MMQKNEGQWQFSLDESSNGHSIELTIAVCRYLDTSLIQADVQPQVVRLLIQACPTNHRHGYVVRLPWHLLSFMLAGAGRVAFHLSSRCL